MRSLSWSWAATSDHMISKFCAIAPSKMKISRVKNWFLLTDILRRSEPAQGERYVTMIKGVLIIFCVGEAK